MDEKHKKHIVFLRKFESTADWGGTEQVMLDWFKRINYSVCRVTLVVSPEVIHLFQQRMDHLNSPAEIIPFPFSLETPYPLRFRNMLGFFRKLKPSKIIFVHGWFEEFRWPDLLAGFLVCGRNMFIHENLGATPPEPRQSRRYFGFIPGLALWWHLRRWRLNCRTYFCKHVFTVSEGIRQRLISYWGYPKHKVKVIYHGVDAARYSPSMEMRDNLRKDFHLDSRDIVIIATARFTKQKRLERLIEAFQAVATQYKNLHLFLAGKGQLEAELKELAMKGASGDRIRFLGEMKNVPDLLKMCDFYVLSSDNEGLSLALMEAMASGLICISTHCPGSAEAIVDEVNGFLVDLSMEGVKSGLQKALHLSLEERKLMVQQARKTVLEKFELNKNIEKLFKITGIPYQNASSK